MTGADGSTIEGVEGIRAGLYVLPLILRFRTPLTFCFRQELGPRFTLKPRRVDKGIGRAGSEGDDAVQWEWKGRMDKVRTAFNV